MWLPNDVSGPSFSRYTSRTHSTISRNRKTNQLEMRDRNPSHRGLRIIQLSRPGARSPWSRCRRARTSSWRRPSAATRNEMAPATTSETHGDKTSRPAKRRKMRQFTAIRRPVTRRVRVAVVFRECFSHAQKTNSPIIPSHSTSRKCQKIAVTSTHVLRRGSQFETAWPGIPRSRRRSKLPPRERRAPTSGRRKTALLGLPCIKKPPH